MDIFYRELLVKGLWYIRVGAVDYYLPGRRLCFRCITIQSARHSEVLRGCVYGLPMNVRDRLLICMQRQLWCFVFLRVGLIMP